ncbi:MAG: tryptophan halogenase [Sphingomonas sp.]|nr:tryptophan halogenase [Sphingomonas sp.]
MTSRAIRTIAVVGNGIAGWNAAAALKKRVPGISVALVPVADLKPGLADLCASAAPSIGDFHRDIGLSESDIVLRTGAAFRLGSRYQDWHGPGSGFFHAYGPAGFAQGQLPFAALWLRAGSPRPYQDYAPGAVLAEQGRFLPGDYAHGLMLDLHVYPRFLAAYARHLDVLVSEGTLAGMDVSDGRVTGLRLSDGSTLRADMYVDASNVAASLMRALADPDWQDWRQWLPADTLERSRTAPDPGLPPFDRVRAISNGWEATISLPACTETLRVTAKPGDAGASAVRFASGRRAQAWSGNVVAIGDAYAVIEPLEGAPLHLLHSQIDRLVGSLPDRDFDAIELAQYNRETGEEADRVRDFLIAHYVLSGRCDAAPPLLAETLALFAHRGRLPMRDGESFDKHSWLALLFGHGTVPAHADPLAVALDTGEAQRALADHRLHLEQGAAKAPAHSAYLKSLEASA